MTQLLDLVQYVYSKNAGPFLITFDVMFKHDQAFRQALDQDVFTAPKIAALYGIAVERVISIHPYSPARVIKFTISRAISSGDFGDSSVFGSQQWAPLLSLDIAGSPPGDMRKTRKSK